MAQASGPWTRRQMGSEIIEDGWIDNRISVSWQGSGPLFLRWCRCARPPATGCKASGFAVGDTGRSPKQSPLVSTRGVGRDERAVGKIDGDFRTADAEIGNSLAGSSLGQILIADEEITEPICG